MTMCGHRSGLPFRLVFVRARAETTVRLLAGEHGIDPFASLGMIFSSLST